MSNFESDNKMTEVNKDKKRKENSVNTKNKENKGLDISVKSFITAILVIFALMILTYILTFIVPGGQYERVVNANGDTVIDTSAAFINVDGGIPFWKWILSPFMVLGADGSGTIIAIIVFLLIIGGVFNSLDKCGLMKYMLDKIVNRFGKSRYKLMAVIILFFMLLGSFVGSFEECVPLVPIVVSLAISLGWDALTGMAMSLLAIGSGFAAGVCNPFTVGVAQKLAGLAMFSGMWYRFVAFVLIYLLLLGFIRLHARKIERPISEESSSGSFSSDSQMDKALGVFVGVLGLGILLIVSSVFITSLQDYTMIIVALMFLIAGISSSLLAGIGGKGLGTTFWNGLVSIFPAVFMILMAASIKYTLEEAHILDTLLHNAVNIASTMPTAVVIIFIYLVVLVMNFFISSGSAKAFLLMPLIVPIAQIFGIPAQLCVMAYAFGDGFSNVFYPTNPVLLISCGLANVSYTKWAKWTWKFQMLNLLLTSALLLLGLKIGYC